VSRVMSSRVLRSHVMLPQAARKEQPDRVRLREFVGCHAEFGFGSARFQVKGARLHGAREMDWKRG
jgi:hypothetical protein